MPEPSGPTLQGQIEDLRRRLAEAQETLDAIRAGEVDAIVVNQGEGNQVFTLDGAERPYRLFIEEMQQGAVTLSPDGRILFSNRRFEEMVQVRQQDVIGRSFEDFIRPGHQENWFPLMRQAKSARATGEVQLEREGGDPFPASIGINTMDTATGRIYCMVVADLTEQKEYQRRKVREEEILALNRTLRAISNSRQALIRSQSAPEAEYLAEICRVVTEDCGYAMVWIGFAELDEAKSIRPVASSGFEVGYLEKLQLTWADSERGRGPSGMAIRTGKPAMCRDMMTDPAFGPWRAEALARGYRSSLVLPLLNDHQTFGSIAIYAREADAFPESELTLLRELASDVSYAITLNRLRAEHAKAEAAIREVDRRKDEFLAILAHELRNPLAPIRTAAHILNRRETDDPDLRSYYDVIERQAGQMARLVDDLLDVARLERGKIELRRERVDFCSLAAHAVEVCRSLIEEGRHRAWLDLPERALEVNGDPVRVEQMICNLITNACKYTPPGGEIRIAVRREGDAAVLRVKDNGIGVTPEVMDHIFEMFYQGGQAVGHREGGLGIGLTLVNSLARLHGGSIAASSAGPGKGSEFTLCLPAMEPAHDPVQAPEDDASIPAPTGKPKHILVVDDNPSVVLTVKMLLSTFGYRVSVASNGMTGIKQALELRPDLALVDLGLPDLSGLEVAARIRADLGTGIHLIALTGFSRESDIAAALAAGFDRHLVKSADPVELINAVNALLA